MVNVPLMFLFDVDNTLLDNDCFTADLTAWLEQSFGHTGRERYWAIYAARREETGYADYLGALQTFRIGEDAQSKLQATANFLLEYPFEQLLYPDALAAVRHLAGLAPVLIVSDGDMVFQPHKIRRSGLDAAFAQRVLIYVHKQHSLADLQSRYCASHYVMIDDKPSLLAEIKRVLGSRVTTVFVRQGHYAREASLAPLQAPPDRTVDRIGDLLHLSLADFPGVPAHAPDQTISETP